MTDRRTDRGGVTVQASSRLHFGLFSFGHERERQFGGVGVMVDRPAVQLEITSAERFTAEGPLEDRIRAFAARWADFQGWSGELPCHVTLRAAAPQHVGLGVGTQLALSIATGLNAFWDRPQPSPAELALSVGRGARSAVGTYGFVSGGLVVERGKGSGEPIAPREVRLDLPAAWRFVLLQPPGPHGLSGSVEHEAFGSLPPVPAAVTEELVREVRERMVPAAAAADFEGYSESVYQFGRLAGSCFASVQGGPYNGPRLTALVDWLRQHGIRGVGQSSWGPTLFAILPNESQAQDFLSQLAGSAAWQDVSCFVAAPDNRGARLQQTRAAVTT
jgi:beta-ribofuranosylaminobenzene 5'-phosphate synthase